MPMISGRRFSAGTSALGGRHDAGLARRGLVLLGKIEPPVRAQQLQVVAAELLGVPGIGKNLQVGAAEHLRGGNAGVLLESLVPVEVPELVARILDEKIDRNIVQDGIHERVELLDPGFVFHPPRDVAAKEPNHLALLGPVVDQVADHLHRHDPPGVVLETDGIFERPVVAADRCDPLLPLLARGALRTQLVNPESRHLALDPVAVAELRIGELHAAVQRAGVNLLLDVVDGILERLEFAHALDDAGHILRITLDHPAARLTAGVDHAAVQETVLPVEPDGGTPRNRPGTRPG